MDLIYDLVDATELQGFVRNIGLPEYGLSAWLPDVHLDDIRYRIESGNVPDMDVAHFRSWDTPSSRGKRVGVATTYGNLPPISKMMHLGEEEIIELQRFRGAGGAPARTIVDQIFADARALARSVYGRLEVAKSHAIFNGVVDINENGLAFSIDQGYASGQIVDLVADGYADVYLDDPTCDILGAIEKLIEDYQERTNGLTPGAILAPRKFRSLLRKAGVVIADAFGMAGSGITEATPAQLKTVLANFDVPPIYVNETSLPVDGTATRIVPLNQFALLPPPGAPNPATVPSTQTLDPNEIAPSLGKCFWGTTAEALKLASAQQIAADLAPGITAVTLEQDHPVAAATNVSAIALPVLGNPAEVTVVQFTA